MPCSDGGWSEVEHKLRHPHTKADFGIMWLADRVHIFSRPRDERIESTADRQPRMGEWRGLIHPRDLFATTDVLGVRTDSYKKPHADNGLSSAPNAAKAFFCH
jgi:hypothetical protein